MHQGKMQMRSDIIKKDFVAWDQSVGVAQTGPDLGEDPILLLCYATAPQRQELRKCMNMKLYYILKKKYKM